MKIRKNMTGNKALSEEYGKTPSYFDSMKSQANEKYLFICGQTESGNPLKGARILERKLLLISSNILDLIYILEEKNLRLSAMIKYAIGEENFSASLMKRVQNFSTTWSYSHYMHEKDLIIMKRIATRGKEFICENELYHR